jgi:hypothetical protein
LKSKSYRYGSGNDLDFNYNVTIPLVQAIEYDVSQVDCQNLTEIRYANSSFIVWKDLMANSESTISLKVNIEMIKNLVSVAYENLKSIDE